MACYEPLRAFKIGKTKNGKDKYKICGSWTEAVLHDSKTGKWIPCGFTVPKERIEHIDEKGNVRLNGTDIVNSRYDIQISHFIEIPCGKCLGCREVQAKEWTDRILMELETAKTAYFLTLTYNDQFLKYIGYTDHDGVVTDIPTLCYRDVQLFLKRLRKDGQQIRFFCAGEYGSKNHRPHYHMIIFNLELDDLEAAGRNFQGDILYKSNYLEKKWENGFVVIGCVTKDSANYTARYVLKKYETAAVDYEKYGLENEFCRASKRPALGRPFIEAHVRDFQDHSLVPVYSPDGVCMVSLPKYGKRLYKSLELCQDVFEKKSSENQEIIRNQREQASNLTDLDYRYELQNKQTKKEAALKALHRDL